MNKRILLALDGSATAEQALPVTIEQVKKFQSQLHLLRVIRPISKSYQTGMASHSAIEKTEEELRLMAEEYLQKLAAELENEGIEVQIATRMGIPYKEIINYADQNQIDLIVLCTRGESGFTRWMLGSNTDHVIRGTRVPVLIVPPSRP
jgi:nucleotide-binding universal stress UspA family protein